MGIKITGGRIIDPGRGLDEVGDIFIRGDMIVERLESDLVHEVIDASGQWVVPGLIDAHVHLREPGGERKETLETGLKAAARGGFTSVLAMPNTTPPIDSPALARMLIERAEELGGTRLFPVPAVTVGRRGEQVGDLVRLFRAGAVAFSDDGSAVANDKVMEKALRLCLELGLPIAQHAEDPLLSRNGALHNGEVARRLGVPGWPPEAEHRIVERDIALVEKTGARLHVSHISTARAVESVRRAKERGLPVSAEVTPHHLHLTDEAAMEQGTLAKVNPPLRSWEDREACRSGLVDGTIDIVATDHAPHTEEDKLGGFEQAAFGMVGLEVAVPLLLLLVEEGVLTPVRMIEAMSTGPAAVFGLRGGSLSPGSIADVTIIDPADPHKVDPSTFASKSRNTPFGGWRVPGRTSRTLVGGKTVFPFIS